MPTAMGRIPAALTVQWAGIAYCCLAMLLPCPVSAAEESQAPYVLREGFESLVGGKPAGWAGIPPAAWQAGADSPHTGTGCMAAKGRPEAPANDWSRLITTEIPVSPGDVVDVSLWTRATSAAIPAVPACLIEYEAGGESHRSAVYFKPSTDWRLLRNQSDILPRGTTKLRVRITVSPAFPAEEAWYVDDLEVKIVSLRQYVAEAAGLPRMKDVWLLAPGALRQSALGCYGDARSNTPAMDSIARDGIVYEQVTTACPWAKPAYASIFSGLYPSQHAADDVPFALPRELTTLAEHFKARGYFTAGFVFGSRDSFLGADMGYGQGFDVYVHQKDADNLYQSIQRFLDLNAEALSGMRSGGLFLFYHMHEAHAPYRNTHPDLVRNAGKLGTVNVSHKGHLAPIQRGVLEAGKDYVEEDLDYIRDLYRLGIIENDRRINSLVTRLKWAGIYERLNIVLTSGHGEALGEVPGRWEHGAAWETITRIPLALRFPGVVDAGQVDTETLCSSLDIYPTLLDLIGAPLPPRLEGASLLQHTPWAPTRLRGITEDRRHGWLAVRGQRFKLIAEDTSKKGGDGDYGRWTIREGAEGPRMYLYDLEADPLEERDLAKEKPELLKALSEVLYAHCRRTGIIGGASETRTAEKLSAETQQWLDAMGYLD